MWAAAEGHADVVQALIDAGADVKQHLPSGFTPLLFAVRQGHLGVVSVLLKAGADVNEAVVAGPARGRAYGGGAPPVGTTPLMMAVKNAHFELAAALLDAGANPNADGTGYTVLHAMTVVRKPGVGDNDPAPEGSGTMTSIELVKKLVAKGANVNARMTRKANLNNTRGNEMGATPFYLAAVTADVELLKVLHSGADPMIERREALRSWRRPAAGASEDAGTRPRSPRPCVPARSGRRYQCGGQERRDVMHAAA